MSNRTAETTPLTGKATPRLAIILFILLNHSANAIEPIVAPPPEFTWTQLILALLICTLIVFIGQFATPTGGPSVKAGGRRDSGWTAPTLGH